MRWIGVAAVVAALAFAGAGCGGSSESDGEAVVDTAVTETSSTETTDTTSTDMSSSTEETSTESSGISGLTGECEDLAGAGEKFSAAVASATAGGSSDLEATAAAFDEFANEAPDELKDDFEALAEVMTAYATAFDDLDLEPGAVPNAEQIAKLAQLGQSLSTEKAQKASAAIAAWATANCTPNP
jgi:hypothetical protein